MNIAKKLIALLTSTHRRKALILLCLMIVGALVETASVGLIIPAIAMIASDDLASSYPNTLPILEGLGYPTQKQLIILCVGILFIVYLFKSLFLAFLTWRQNAFVFGVRANISQRLFTIYLRQSWDFHLQRNSAQLINILANETNQVTANGLLPMMLFIADLLVLISICVLLVYVEGLVVLVLFATLGFAAWAFYRMTKGFILQLGRERHYHESLRIQHAQQGLNGAKDVKLLGREDEFLASYLNHNIGSTRAVEWQNTLQQMPRLWLEVLAVAGLVILVILMISQHKPVREVASTLALFAMATFRIMPSAYRIVGAIQSIRFARPAIDTIYEEITNNKDKTIEIFRAPSYFCRSISLKNVSYRYPQASVESLFNISLTIPLGASIGLVGESGSGKSTLVDLILGLLKPSSGYVLLDEVDIQSNLRGWQDLIGYVPQAIYLTDDSLRRNVAFGLPENQIDDVAVQRAIRSAQLEDFVRSLPNGVQTLVGERGVRLSGGQRQRIGIARALYHDPQVLVLDEATSALDTATEEEVMASVNALIGKKTLIIVAHRLSTVALCDRLYRLERGRIVEEGTLGES